MPIQTPYSSLSALVVDDMAVQQTTLRGQLASLGIGRVDAAGTAEDALRLVRSRPYGLILCDYNLNQKTDGQQLFEHLRETGALPPDCLFFMITAENAYASVASATEHRPDAYLLKPITAADISERLKMLIERRQALLGIHQRLGRRDLAGALGECDKVLKRKDRWFVQAMQLQGDILLQLGRHAEARSLYEQAIALRADQAWAQVGLAKALKAAGDLEAARQLAADILASPAGGKHLAAYDVLAQSLEALGRDAEALQALADAAAVVPSAKRQRLLGESAYRQGELAIARDALRKATKATQGAMNAQPQDSLTLAQAQVDLGDLAGAIGTLKEAGRTLQGEARLEAAAAAIGAQAQARAGDPAAAAASAARARDALKQAGADFATIAVAKAQLVAGSAADGLALLGSAVAIDHESPALRGLVARTLRETGHEDRLAEIVDAPAAAVTARVDAARRLLREGQVDEALAAIEETARLHAENTGVLLQAAQIHCLSLRLRRRADAGTTERIALYFARLDKLMPGSDRLAQLRRYYADSLRELAAAPAAA
ncbi:response regulator [Aquincola sp. MAHUQ-54]|uniref:Response regulator n=1 Tax=Aquincola agrisoli TaxID=3119538 RepID=A0AAW9Q874_9BURK